MLICDGGDGQENRCRKPGKHHQKRQRPATFRADTFHHSGMGRSRQAAGRGQTHHDPAEDIADHAARKGEHDKTRREQQRTRHKNRGGTTAHQRSSQKRAAEGADRHHDGETGKNDLVCDGQFLSDAWPQYGQHVETGAPADDLPNRKHADKARARREGGGIRHDENRGCEMRECFW
ncbi:hypothetical protein D3C80_1431440 [compost metagenome]